MDNKPKAQAIAPAGFEATQFGFDDQVIAGSVAAAGIAAKPPATQDLSTANPVAQVIGQQ